MYWKVDIVNACRIRMLIKEERSIAQCYIWFVMFTKKDGIVRRLYGLGLVDRFTVSSKIAALTAPIAYLISAAIKRFCRQHRGRTIRPRGQLRDKLTRWQESAL